MHRVSQRKGRGLKHRNVVVNCNGFGGFSLQATLTATKVGAIH